MFPTTSSKLNQQEYLPSRGWIYSSYHILAGDYKSSDIVQLMISMYEYIRDYRGDIPGASPRECGNYLDLNLNMANYLADRFLSQVLYDIDESRLNYPQ